MVALNVNNAFNSASWAKIIKAVAEKDLPEYLCQSLDRYLWNRKLIFENMDSTAEAKVTTGVP